MARGFHTVVLTRKHSSKCTTGCNPKGCEKKTECEPGLFLHLIQSYESQRTLAFKQAEDSNKKGNPPSVFQVKVFLCYYTGALETLSL